MTGEELGFLMSGILEQLGVLDVYQTGVQMKKNRPGTLITVLTKVAESPKIEEYLLRQSSTFGVRRSVVERNILDRQIIEYQSPVGLVRIKLGLVNQEVIKAVPEFEDVKKIAEETQRPFRQVYSEIESHCLKLIKRK